MRFRRPRLSEVFAADLINRFSRLDPRSIRFDDRVKSWEEALEKSTGYSDQHITNRLLRACRAVREGLAVAQRDGVLLDHLPVNWPLSTCLLLEMSTGDPLRVIDFGGDLGSTYHAVKAFLPNNVALEWLVVEQPSVVEVGRREFSTVELGFSRFEEIPPSRNLNTLLLLSNTVQYLSQPEAVVQSLIEMGVRSIIFDMVPTLEMIAGKVPSIQHVPSSLGKCSYPAWLFSSNFFANIADFAPHETYIASSWENTGPPYTRRGRRIAWRGAFLKAIRDSSGEAQI